MGRSMNGQVMMNALLKNKSLLIKSGIVLGVVAGYFLIPTVYQHINQATFMLSGFNVEMVRGYILSFGVLAPIVSFLLMIFQSIAAPLPAFLITFANAGIFGWIKGAILSWSSAMAGASICFFISKYFGRSFVEKLTSKTSLQSVDIFFERYGKYAILIARLLPFVSFDIVSYAAGLTGMSFWAFFWATGIGQLPATIIYSYIGGMLTGGTKYFVFGLLILFACSTLIYMLKKIWSDRNKEDKKDELEIEHVKIK